MPCSRVRKLGLHPAACCGPAPLCLPCPCAAGCGPGCCAALRGMGALGPNDARKAAVNDDVQCVKCACPHAICCAQHEQDVTRASCLSEIMANDIAAKLPTGTAPLLQDAALWD